MNKIINWLKESNRILHLQCGVAVMIVLFAVGMLGNDIFNEAVKGIGLEAFVGTFIAMCSVEYIQKKMGCKWDWNDILAGCSVAFLLLVVLLLM